MSISTGKFSEIASYQNYFQTIFVVVWKIIEIQYLIAESDLNGAFARDLLENKELILYIL